MRLFDPIYHLDVRTELLRKRREQYYFKVTVPIYKGSFIYITTITLYKQWLLTVPYAMLYNKITFRLFIRMGNLTPIQTTSRIKTKKMNPCSETTQEDL